MLHYLANDGG